MPVKFRIKIICDKEIQGLEDKVNEFYSSNDLKAIGTVHFELNTYPAKAIIEYIPFGEEIAEMPQQHHQEEQVLELEYPSYMSPMIDYWSNVWKSYTRV